ncbi:MAG TPA: tetratricopeptide repeat protein [Planctomycetota bacterium]|nr:tetratricopeptide repeat protein [Planctomycetota bacterium]
MAIVLALATAGAYAGILHAGFVNLDDPVYVVQNEHVRAGLTLDGLRWAFGTTDGANWHPLTWISHMLDVQLFGVEPAGHHATSVVLHVASALVLLLALDRLTRAFWPSALVAALFALHPLHVESVAWIAERKDVLSTFFWMLVLLAYARHVEAPSRVRLAVVVVVFALGLMSKPMLVTLPCVLLLLDHWPLARTARTSPARLVREKIPLFALSAAASLAAYLAQRTTGAVAPRDVLSLTVRASNALVSYLRYLGRTFWPVDLAAYYPHLKVVEVGPLLAAIVVLGAITWFALRERRRRPYLLVGWLWYLGTLVPVIGIVQVGAQAMADRYTYVPLVGVFVMLAWSIPRIAAWSAVPALAALALVTRHQVAYWKDTRTLFAHTLAVTVDNAIAEKCYGDALMAESDLDGAIAHLSEAVRLAPALVDAHNNLGAALGAKGRFEEALVQYRAELAARPRAAETLYNLGFALVSLGRVDEGIAAYEQALAIDPNLSDAHAKLGVALGTKSRFAEAETHFRAELRQTPRSAELRYDLGFALVNQGRIDEGIAEYEEALAIDPDHFRAHSKLGIALGSKGKLPEALVHLRAALASHPDDVETRRWAAVTLTLSGEVEAAILEYEKLLEADPNDVEAMNPIAWIRATHAEAKHRDGKAAVALAERARDASPRPNAVLFETLAAAYAEAGRFDDAATACARAIELAKEGGETKNAERFRSELELYRAGKPLRVN